MKFNIVITMGKSAKNLVWLLLLTGGSYCPNNNASELHFARSFKGICQIWHMKTTGVSCTPKLGLCFFWDTLVWVRKGGGQRSFEKC